MKKYIVKIVECNTGYGEDEYIEFAEKDNPEDILYMINLHLDSIYDFIKNEKNEEYYGDLISIKENISMEELNKMIDDNDFTIEIAEDPNDIEKHIYLRTVEINNIYEEEISLLKVTPKQLNDIRYFFTSYINDNYKISNIMLKYKNIELKKQCEQIGLHFCYDISSITPIIRYTIEFTENLSVDKRIQQTNLLEKKLFKYIKYYEKQLTLECSL